MKQPIHVLYLPGFGDKNDRLRAMALSWWHYRDITVELIPIKWNKGTFDEKIKMIDDAIDQAKGKRIVLIGESAGGSMVVHMCARRPNDIYKALSICGKNTHPETVGERYYERSPVFKESMSRLNNSLAKLTEAQNKEFISIHPPHDSLVPVRETLLPECRQVVLWSLGHMTTIALALTLYRRIIIREIRRP